MGLTPFYRRRGNLVYFTSFQRCVKPIERTFGVFQMLVGIMQRAAVMRAQDEKTHHFRLVAVEYLAHGKKVTQRLGHLLIIDTHETIVHPVVDERMLMRAFTLRNLVFMMGKLQVLSAAMYIEMFTQIMLAHRRAFDMPAGTSHAPRRIPLGFSGLRGFP